MHAVSPHGMPAGAAPLIGVATALVLIVGPLLLGALGLARSRGGRNAVSMAPSWNWKLTIASTLLYVLAFNLTFFIQELFLVLPKALLPGVEPTLFHNNHRWTGQHPLTSLFQGTGALAILVSGMVCAVLLARGPRSGLVRLFLLWMVYHGVLMAMPQVVTGALLAGNDVGMALNYLRLGTVAKTTGALLALAMIPVVALWLTRHLLALAPSSAAQDARGRCRFVLQAATVPALAAIALIIPFRVPREALEVLVPPVVVAIIGVSWMQAGAWRLSAIGGGGSAPGAPLAWLALAVIALLLVFQLVLRPGIDF